MNDEDVIITDGTPIDPGDSSDTPPVDEETVPDIHDEGDRPDIDWDETGVEGDADAQQTFTSQPVPPYRAGDLWENQGSEYVCINGKDEGESFASDDWIPAEAAETTPTTVTNTITIVETITDFSAESIADYQARGAVAYAIYDNGTRVQVPWSSVVQPIPTEPEIVADEALAIATATNQHFWQRSTDPDNDGAGTGAFVTDEEQSAFLEAAAAGFPDTTKPYHNLLMNSLGILLRTALKNLVSITKSAIAFYDGQGNEAANVMASFGKDGFQVGVTGKSHLVGDYHSLQLIDKNSATYFHVSDLRDNTGYATVTESFESNGYSDYVILTAQASSLVLVTAGGVDVTSRCQRETVVVDGVLTTRVRLSPGDIPEAGELIVVQYKTSEAMRAFTFGVRRGGVGGYSATIGEWNTASGIASFAEGYGNTASEHYSHAEGRQTTASGRYSHAEGNQTVASGWYSHAEGYLTSAAYSSHAEGARSEASGHGAHAEGSSTVASGDDSHAQNIGTVAASGGQTALGKYNVEDANDKYAFIIGNGTSDSARSNALTVDWDGNVEASGSVSAGGDLDVTGAATVGGNIAASGNVTAANIGTFVTASGSSISCASSTYVNIANFTLAAGTWIVMASVEMAASTTGRRVAVIGTGSADDSNLGVSFRATENPVSGGPTRVKLMGVIRPTASTTYYFKAWQNSGAAINGTGTVQAVRIK